MKRAFSWAPLALLSLSMLSAYGGDSNAPPTPLNVKPSYVGDVTTTSYDGTSDDLLTAGLGWKGLMDTNNPPRPSDPPTAAELRKLAIYTNYRAIVDTTQNGGYGTLYGPQVPPDGKPEPAPPDDAGKVKGVEYLAPSLDDARRPAATLMVQIPDDFDVTCPCIVTASSPGSRGIYGAIGAVGEWGLKHRCAVAYTDKGTGSGVHDLTNNTVTLINGLAANAAAAGKASLFTADLTDAEREDYVLKNPFGYAVKHAHSRRNVQKHWGRFTLQAVEFALYAINDRFAPAVPGTPHKARRFIPANTLVIASSVSNGGGSALAATEQDEHGLIDAVVIGEPQFSLRVPDGLKVQRGRAAINHPGRPIYDYISYANLIQPCAAFADAAAGAPMLDDLNKYFRPFVEKRAKELARDGIVPGASFSDQANGALEKLHEAGYEPASDVLHASYFGTGATTGVTVTFANAYARASVKDNLCDFRFATAAKSSDAPSDLVPPLMPTVFGIGNGIPPTPRDGFTALDVMYRGKAGTHRHLFADGDLSYSGAKALRALWTDDEGAQAEALKKGVAEVLLTGRLRGKPAIIVHGRSDTLVLVNHTSRPYLGMSRLADGWMSRITYIEVTNAQHFDGFIPNVKGYAERFVPLHYYNLKALDLMWEHLRTGAPLPPPQVVHTTPRGNPDVPIEVDKHLKPISFAPPQGDAIEFDPVTRTVGVPD